MKNFPTNKSAIRLSQNLKDETFEAGVLADSLEVMEAHIRHQIGQLEIALNKLNLLDHPVEIISLCKQMTEQRLLLARVELKRRRASYGR